MRISDWSSDVCSSDLQNNGIWTAIITVVSIALFLLAAAAFIDPAVIFGGHGGNFYAVLSHNVMVTVFGLLALFVLAAIVIGMARFWRLVGEIGRAQCRERVCQYV